MLFYSKDYMRFIQIMGELGIAECMLDKQSSKFPKRQTSRYRLSRGKRRKMVKEARRIEKMLRRSYGLDLGLLAPSTFTIKEGTLSSELSLHRDIRYGSEDLRLVFEEYSLGDLVGGIISAGERLRD